MVAKIQIMQMPKVIDEMRCYPQKCLGHGDHEFPETSTT